MLKLTRAARRAAKVERHVSGPRGYSFRPETQTTELVPMSEAPVINFLSYFLKNSITVRLNKELLKRKQNEKGKAAATSTLTWSRQFYPCCSSCVQ